MKNTTAASTAMTPHFSGHETFPLRQMWLKKAFDKSIDGKVAKTIFSDDNAIAEFGVGKNMVGSIRHWALACDVLRDDSADVYTVSDWAMKALDDLGWDPYAEHPTTAWHAHWQVAGRGNRATTWHWLFNHVTASSFSREELEPALMEYALSLEAKRKLSPATLSRDLETCLRGYAPRVAGASPEEYAEPLLGELSLLHEERKGQFAFRRGPKPTLNDAMFAYALLDYWDRFAPGLSSLSFEAIAYGEGSPGRVFKLDEESVAERLFGLGDLTRRALTWTDTAGLRQVHRKSADNKNLSALMIERAYD